MVNMKILVVDDDPSSIKLIQHVLELEGYDVVVAENGLQALKKAASENPDFVILDLMLPGVDGFEVCRRMRKESNTAHVPILILSGKEDEANMVEAFKVGADAYMIKPFKSPELRGQIRKLLAAQSTNSAE